MQEKMLQPFINAACEVLKEYFHTGVKPLQVETTPSSFAPTGMLVSLGITGELNGRLLLDLSESTAFEMAKMYLREEIKPTEKDLIVSTICELGNIISGRAISFLNEVSRKVRMTPPIFIRGKEMIISDRNPKNLTARIESPIGIFTLNLSVKEFV